VTQIVNLFRQDFRTLRSANYRQIRAPSRHPLCSEFFVFRPLAPGRENDMTRITAPTPTKGKAPSHSPGSLSCARPTGWLWARVAGDVLDLATLGEAVLESEGEQRQRAMISTAVVAGVMALDLACSGTLSAVDAMEG
jgi:hypothetical protein